MLVRRNSNIDTDELERAIGVLKMQMKNEDNAIDKAMYQGAINALGIIYDGHVKSYEDFLVIFERYCFDKTTGGSNEQSS